MKVIFTLSASIICLFTAIAQDETVKDLQASSSKKVKSLDSNGWHSGGTLIINLNQGALSNWVAGGEENVFGVNGIINYAINHKGDRHNWDNFLDVAIGFQNASSFKKFRKIDDRIDLTSKYGRVIAPKWNVALLFNFNTQALPGYDYSTDPPTKISNFLTPGKILLSPGLDFRPGNRFSLFVSPATIRWILKRDPDFLPFSRFGVDAGEKSNTEFGAFLTARYLAPFTRWASFSSRLDLFSNYRRDPQNIDILMNNLLTMKFTKGFATNLSVDLVYDHDVLQKLQLKEILGIGLTLAL